MIEPEVSYGEALGALKAGHRICRLGWNGKRMFVFKQIPATIPAETIPKMQSLPQSVKDHFARELTTEIKYENQMCIVFPTGTINSWVASSSDALATDWIILD